MTEATTLPLDFALYPHVVDRIVSYADASCLAALRATCQTFRRSVERRMYSHIAVRVSGPPPTFRSDGVRIHPYDTPEGYAGFKVELFAPSNSAPVSHRVPGLRWPEPAITNLTPYIDIVDFEDAREERWTPWASEPCEAARVFNLAGRARVVRRWYDKSLMHAGEPFSCSDDVPDGQVSITFVDYTVVPAVQQLVSGPRGVHELASGRRWNHMPQVSVTPHLRGDSGPGNARGIVNVRYDPRQPDLRYGALDLRGIELCEEIVVIFTPTKLWTGPQIPKPEMVNADRPMGWLHLIVHNIRFRIAWKACETAGEIPPWIVDTRFMFVGAEQLDAGWVDSPAWHFENPVTNADLAAGAAKVVEDACLEGPLSPEELAETLAERGGWDGIFRFITLDEWKAEVDPELFDLATIAPAKPLYTPVDIRDTIGNHRYNEDFSPEEWAAAIAKQYGTSEAGNEGP
ncbi:uncharacterized protein LOC62_02G003463 [Vanrija pseudolonga]|uniref:F-box domain-containing protein n=1 Tax=Vanrija pseudolonga TaxID=143232 RepID=A0AAF1BKS5_9TREE|nr:hypothetical protein LOC62_02G003463 [Vanrija pseudolonga]